MKNSGIGHLVKHEQIEKQHFFGYLCWFLKRLIYIIDHCEFELQVIENIIFGWKTWSHAQNIY